MTITAEAPGTVETPNPAPAGPPKPRTSFRAIVGWAAVVAALVAAGLLALLVVNNDSGASRTDLPGIAENGSIRAIEHRDEVRRVAASQTVAEQGSIRAVEHRDEVRREAASQTVAEQGSIRAVEHRDELSREAASQTEVSQEYVDQLVARR